MLSIEIVCVGKLGQKFYREGCAEYLKRLGPFAKVTVTELAETRLENDSPAARNRVIEEESARILSHLERTRAQIVALCVEGEQLSSEQLADYLSKAAMQAPKLAFVIGGSLGLSESLKRRAALRMSMSRMTLPHQLARLVLCEQLYRACTINANIKYHK